ncbi:MAG: hypothetical protein WC521_02270 [Bdellovibrionales bacterium]
MQSHYPISPTQSKAARTYLSWSQEVLAKAAGVGRSTVCSYEDGLGVRPDSVERIREAFEKQGIEFTDGDGVRRRDLTGVMHRSHDVFYNDLLETVKQQGGEIFCIVKNMDVLMQVCGDSDIESLERLNILSRKANFRCLVSEAQVSAFNIPSVQIRRMTSRVISPYSYFGYGNKYAHAVQEGQAKYIYAVFNLTITAREYRREFMAAWNDAVDLQSQTSQQERRVSIRSAI